MIHADEKYIMQGCNAQGKMGSGVAKAIRDRWPEVYKPYKEYCHNNRKNQGFKILGTILPVYCEDKVILNAITQQYYGYNGARWINYEAIYNVFDELNYRLDPGTAIALPRIGASLGGGNWKIISTIIEEVLEEIHPVVYDL